MDVTAFGENIADLNARAATVARSTVVELINRPYLDVFNLDLLIPQNIDLLMKLMPFSNNLVFKSATPGQVAQKENYKLVIYCVNLNIRTKMLIITAHGALMDLLVKHKIQHYLSCVQMKHLSIPGNHTSINFDNVFTGALSNSVIVG